MRQSHFGGRFGQAGGAASDNVFKDAGTAGKDALKDAGEAVTGLFRGVGESFRNADIKHGFGWGFGRREAGQNGTPSSKTVAPPAPPPAPVPASSSGGSLPPPGPPAPDDDAAMRNYCQSLERLVGMAYSPQAARAALQHLDDWLASPSGSAVIAAAEAAARAEGENILHVGDRVRLEGLVKNPLANGKVGTLQAYGAESQRWRVNIPDDAKVYWIKPKLLTRLELERLPLDSPTDAALVHTSPSGESENAQALAAGWARLEASRTAWREQRELQELELDNKEHRLKELQAELELQQQELGERRRTIALEAAKNIAQMEQSMANMAPPDQMGRRLTAEFTMATDETPTMTGNCVDSDGSEPQENEEDGDMWDMDWTSLPSAGGAPEAPKPSATHFAPPARLISPSSEGIVDPTDSLIEASPTALASLEPTVGASLAAKLSVAENGPATFALDSSHSEGASASPSPPGNGPATFMRMDSDSDEATEACPNVDVGSDHGNADGAPAADFDFSVAGNAAHASADTRHPSAEAAQAQRRGFESPPVDDADDEELKRKLEEKRRLAELHNGEDLTLERKVNVDKGEMPGVHPAFAEKLMIRRKQLDEAEAAEKDEPAQQAEDGEDGRHKEKGEDGEGSET